jgi:hypothetical protein
MATPVKDRKTIELNDAKTVELRRLLLQAREDEKKIVAYRKALEDKLKKRMGEAEELKIGGVLAFTYAKTDSYAWAEFSKAHPEIAETYTVSIAKDVLDKDRLLADHGALLAEFQTRNFLVK